MNLIPNPCNQPTAAALAARIIRSCSEAGIRNLVEALTLAGNLKDEASIDAAVTRAKAVRDLCVSARLPELAADYVKAGLEPDAVRARLFDKLAGNGFGEIINTRRSRMIRRPQQGQGCDAVEGVRRASGCPNR